MGRNQHLVSSQRVPVSPEIVKKLDNNIAAAYYYAQLLYYDRYEQKDPEGWFSMSSREIQEDIGISRRQQERSRRLLKECGWISLLPVRGGMKPTMKFRILVKLDEVVK